MAQQRLLAFHTISIFNTRVLQKSFFLRISISRTTLHHMGVAALSGKFHCSMNSNPSQSLRAPRNSTQKETTPLNWNLRLTLVFGSLPSFLSVHNATYSSHRTLLDCVPACLWICMVWLHVDPKFRVQVADQDFLWL